MATDRQDKEKTPYRKRGEGSIKMRPNGVWVARVNQVIDGVRRPVQITGVDFDDVMERFEKAKEDIRNYGFVPDPKMTVTVWTERWLEEIAKPKVRPDTWSSYASLLRKWVQHAIGDHKLAKLTPADIRKVRTLMAVGIPGDKAGPSSSSTALKCYRVLRKCLEDARREGLLTQNVADRVDAPKKAVSRRGSFTVEQVRSIFTAAGKIPGGSRYVAGLLLGVRQSEAIGLTLPYVDLDRGIASIAWQLQEIPWQHNCGPRGEKGRHPCGFVQAARCPQQTRRIPDGYDHHMLQGNYALVEVKSKAGVREIPILPPLERAIRLHLEATAHIPNPHGLLWRHDDGSPISHKEDQAGWRALMKAAELDDTCTTHWARHSVATLLLEVGVDAKVVGEIVGHGSVAVTRQNYQHVSTALAREGMGRLDTLLALESAG